MRHSLLPLLALTLTLAPPIVAIPAAPPVPDPVAIQHPEITPPPTLVDRTPSRVAKRDLAGYVGSIISELGSNIPSYVASGVPNFFQDFPSGSAVASSLGSGDLSAVPTQVLNIPGYANWTNSGWSLLVHGNVYKTPNIPQAKIDDLANGFLINTNISSLPPSQQAQARNLTTEIYVVQQPNQNVSFNVVPNFTPPSNFNGGLVAAQGGTQMISIVGQTTDEGDFAQFLPLNNGGLVAGNVTASIQALNYYATNTTGGNATAYLVPPVGFTVISDIDDILRITKIYQPAEGLLNSFARPFTPWMNMPDIYSNWSTSIPDFHFHYLTTTPEQITANYMDFIYKTYPLGSFDTRPLNFSDVSATLSIRKFLLERIFQTFPKRKFILVADTSNSDVMKDYPAMVTEFPGQVQCIFLRNTSSTDPGDKFPYDTSGFQGLNQQQYMFFNVPDDLKGLDITNGQCYNSSVKQNVTFAYQGLPFGAAAGSGATKSTVGLAIFAMAIVTLFCGI